MRNLLFLVMIICNIFAQDLVDNPKAREILKKAYYQRQVLGNEFAGFSADININYNGETFSGKMSFSIPMTLKLEVSNINDELKKTLERSLISMISHRMGGEDFEKGDGSHILTFISDDEHPLGKEISLNDDMGSSYRVKNHQIMQVKRTMRGQSFSVTMLENIVTSNNKYLPKYYVVHYFDSKTKTLLRADTYTNEYTEVSGFYLPATRKVMSSVNGQLEVVEVYLTNHSAQKNASYEIFGEQASLTGEVLKIQKAIDNKNFNNAILLEGVVNSVCQKKGCWIILKEGDISVRVKFKNYSFFLPKDCSGQKVVMEGILTEKVLTEKMARHYAKDAGKSEEEINTIVGETREYSLMASSVKLYTK